jgi:hypothetical protein
VTHRVNRVLAPSAGPLADTAARRHQAFDVYDPSAVAKDGVSGGGGPVVFSASVAMSTIA